MAIAALGDTEHRRPAADGLLAWHENPASPPTAVLLERAGISGSSRQGGAPGMPSPGIEPARHAAEPAANLACNLTRFPWLPTGQAG
ncbi:hypothetical protein SH611_13325 [Geminicoccaceae bacterium 1502E]|nr:hypothetical protein [Geminicoccaceae bacterium 1502E]